MSTSLPPIHKRAGNWLVGHYETALIVFNGEVLVVTFERGTYDYFASSITVRRFTTGEILAEHPWTGGLGCAIVLNGEIHIYGSTNWGNNGNAVIHSTLDSNFAPSPPVVILQANSQYRIFNTDICSTPSGLVMTYETGSGIYFMTSTDNVAFTPVMNASIHQGQYCACPSIAYVDGWYFLTFLSHINGVYVTQVSRSQDLKTWFDFLGNSKYPSYICLLAPDGPGEGINTSDVSLVECAGVVYGVYLVGDQSTWANLRTFVYFGTMLNLMKEFYL